MEAKFGMLIQVPYISENEISTSELIEICAEYSSFE